MRTTQIGRWLKKNNKPFVALLAAGATLAMATLIDASSSSQVEQLGSLAIPRTGHAVTVLADGRVLITGGRDSAGIIVATAEVFDPANQKSTAIGVLNTARIDHTATLLADGRVLIAGGTNVSGALTSAEIFDPANPGAGFRVLSATMGAARARHTATRLHDGRVLIAGGDADGTAEIFEPTAESFSSTLLAMAAPRIGHTAILFSDDSVLLAGGNTDSMEYFSATDQKFTLDLQKMTAVRTGQEAIALDDTHLLFFGGDSGNTIDEFNSSADAITLKGTMNAPASSATLLANGKILVLRSDVAGLYAPDAVDQSSAFIPFDETSVPGSTTLQRKGQTATELSGDKKIIIAGGENAQNQPMLQIAAFNPARIWTDKDDYQPTDPVILSGSGWKANENIYLFAVDSETNQWTYESTITADGNGEFSVDPYFIVQLRQLGTLFHVTAMGAQSSMQAEVEFTDAVNLNSITVGAQTGTAVAAVASSVTYQITASYSGSGTNNDDPVTLSFLGWTGATPAGVTASFSPTTVAQGSPNSTLTLQTSSSTIVAGSYTFTVRGTTAGEQRRDGTGTLTIAPGTATKLALSGSNANLASGSTRVLTATIQDANGNTITLGPNSTLSVTFAKTTGAGTVTGLGSTNAVAGVAALTVTGNQLGSVTISASGSALAAGAGNPITFNVVAGAANKLLLSGSTADLAAGATRQLTATIQDVNGNTITTGADSTLSVTFAKSAGTGTVTGLGSATASAGVATLTITGSAPGSITITASATGSGGALVAGTGNPITFNVVIGAASKLALSGSTANLTAGATRVLTATIQDTAGNTIMTGPDSTLSVTFAKTSGAGSVSGLTSVNATGGVATLTVTGTTAGSVTITASGTGSGGALTAGTGNPITFSVIASTTVDHFAFATISSPQTSGIAFNITITAEDAGNNTVTGYSGNGFKVKLNSTGTLVGAPVTTPAFTNGVLNNQSVTITNTGNFTITATDNSGSTSATGTSNSFQVNPGAAAKLALTGSTANLASGSTRTLTATIQDTNGNTVATGADSTLSVTFAKTSIGGGSVTGLGSSTAVAGVATLTVTGNVVGPVTITASATGSSGALAAGTGNPITFNVVAGNATKLALSGATTDLNSSTTRLLTATIQDTAGNTISTGADSTLSVTFGKTSGTGSVTGLGSSTAVAGVATLTVTGNVAGSVTITASATGSGGALAAGTGNPIAFNVMAGTASKLAFVQQPTTTTAGQTISPAVTVQIHDANGNLTTSTASVGIAILFNPSSGTLNGGTPISAVSGTATFSNLSIDKAGVNYTVQATSTGLTSASSLQFTINNPAPTLASIAPASGNLSDTLDVVFNGTNYLSGVTNVDFGANITVNTVTVNSGTGLTANITIGSGATVGPRNVSVTNSAPGAGTATLTNGFTVNNPTTTTVVTSSSVGNTSTYGQSVTFTATVTTASGTPTGSITFYDSASCSGTVLAGPTNLDANGKASFTTTSLSAPGHTITGCYTPTGIYQASNGSVTQTVNKATLTVKADDKSKSYDGAVYSPFTATVSGFVNSETEVGLRGSGALSGSPSFTGAATTAVNASTTPYTITPTVGSLTATNYTFTFQDGALTIDKKDATWTTDPNSKTYGDNDPNPLTTGSGSGFAATDTVTATYSRASGESVAGGPYHITATLSPSAVLTNYNITNAGADFTITKKNATWTTANAIKTYGANDPTPLTTGSGSGFLFSDNVTASYTRVAGETVGGSPYHITAQLTPATVLANYNVTNDGADFTIEKKDASVTPDPKTKTYGSADPTLTGTLVGFLTADGITAT